MRLGAVGCFTRRAPLTRVALIAACLAPFLTSCEPGVHTLGNHPERYRYTLTTAIQAVTPCPDAIYSVDLDGDGVDEEIKYAGAAGGASYLGIARVGEDRHYALWSRNFLTPAGLCGIADVTGDGVAEMIWWEQPRTRLMRISVSQIIVSGVSARDSTLAVIEWNPAGQLLPDDSWGAGMPLMGAFDSDLDGKADIVAIGMCAGVLKRPRGVWFWDLHEGRFSRKVPLAGTPSGQLCVGDIDADGVEEFVVGLGAPGNQVKEGVWDDSHSYVMAFESDGSILWWHEQGPYSSDVHLLIDDLDGDGTMEVATSVSGHSERDTETFGIYLWRGADGAPLAHVPVGHSVNGVETMTCSGGRRLYAASSDGFLRRFRWDGTTLSLERELYCGDAVEGLAAMPLGREPAANMLVAAMVKGGVVALDCDLSPLAYTKTEYSIREMRSGPLKPTRVSIGGRPEAALMLFTQTSLLRLHLVKRPLPFWMRITLPIVAVVAALSLIPRTRRYAIAGLRRWLLPRASRGEDIDALLASLAAASHGKLAATSTLRRLREQFRMLQNYDGDPPAAFTERFEHAVDDVRQVGVPGIDGIVGGAERLGLAPTHATSLRRSVAALDCLLGELPHGLPSRRGASVLGERLDDLLPGIESALVAIRGAARLERSADPGAEFERAMAARAPEFEELGVEVTFEGRDVLAGIRVCGTPGEISFILENLLGNAVEAMKDGGVRKLRISARADGDRIQLRVSDTGKGIRNEDRQHIFVSGWSGTPSGGGQGLPLSREMLARRGGTLALLESSPGEGAVFGLTLVICQGGAH